MCPSIAITAGEKRRKAKCIAAGMNDYIPKPIIKGIIEEIITKWTLILQKKESSLLNILLLFRSRILLPIKI
jgi:CheY-like chemotaxis protein